MGLFDWLKRERIDHPETSGSGKQAQSIAPEQDISTEKEAFRSPVLLADWVNRFVLEGRPLEEDYKLVPDAEVRANLNITPTQRERCVREYSVLRIAGVSLFIKQHHPDEFWLAFSARAVRHLCVHIYGENCEQWVSEISDAVDAYVLSSESKDVDLCAAKYVERLYHDNENYLRMRQGALGFISCEIIASSYEIFRNTHCQVTHGVSYVTFRSLSGARENDSEREA